MKIKQIWMLVVFFLSTIPLVKAQTFDKLWKQVEQAEKKSLPQTVLQLTSEIFRKAEQDKNSPQMLKAYLWRMKYRDQLTPDSFYVNLKVMEQWAITAENPMDRAVLHSLIASICSDYVISNRWEIAQRTDVVDELPAADIREWTSNQFLQQVIDHTAEALKNQELLLKTSTRSYVPLIELGHASAYYDHDMYHLLSNQGIDALIKMDWMNQDSLVNSSIENIYQSMLGAYKKPGLEDGYILTMLNYLDWRMASDSTFKPYCAPRGRLGLTQDPYLAGLGKLISEFESHDICAEVYLAKARYAMDKNLQTNALQICDDAIRLYARYKRIDALKNLKQEILHPDLLVRTDQIAYPGADFELYVSHKNLDGFTVYLLQGKKELSKQHYALLRPADYKQQDTTFVMKAPAEGKYVMRIVPDTKVKEDIERELFVTRIKALTLSLPGNEYEVSVLDSKSGHPIEHAVVVLYNSDKKKLTEFAANSSWKVTFPYNDAYRYFTVEKEHDKAMPLQGIYGGRYGSYSEANPEKVVKLLTDRVLYRPGQLVHVKGIAYEQKQDTAHVIANQTYTLTLTDANQQEVAKKELYTNEFGSFAAEFILPAACLNGTFTLSTERGMTTIRVEEYKLPTFDVVFDKPTGSYRLGDAIELKGNAKTFSGVVMQGLTVNYVVTRALRWGWRWSAPLQNQEILTSGSVVLDEAGGFIIPVELTGVDKELQARTYVFEVKATVTNLAGETQSSVFSFNVGDRSMTLGIQLQEKLCKDKPIPMTIVANNLDGQPVSVEGRYLLYPIADHQDEAQALKGVPVYTGTFVSNKEINSSEWNAVPSGEYLLVVSAKDDQAREVTGQEKIVLFSLHDTRPPMSTPIWLYEENSSFDKEHPGVFYFGTSEKDVFVMMNVFCDNRLLESKTLQLSDSIVRFEYPYVESYGNGVSVSLCFVKKGKINQCWVKIKKRLSDKILSLKWDVFRDRLRPGQQEEWKLTIKTPHGVPALGEMLAMMYDASLDKIWIQNQELKLYYNLLVPSARWGSAYWSANTYNYLFPDQKLKVDALNYDRFALGTIELFGSQRFDSNRVEFARNFRTRGTELLSSTQPMMKMASNEVAEKQDVSAHGIVQEEGLADVTVRDEVAANLRTNFTETAFFYPQLRTNEQGEISFSFTMPQSLTRWNFRGYAHTKGMLTGMIDGETVTNKEFMLTPNMPRFVRVGDKTSIAATIANLSGKEVSGTVSLVLFDPLTEKIISTQKQKFAVTAGGTKGVDFLFTVTDACDLLGCRMIADGGAFSDGEQRLLAVLSNKVNLLETVAMPIRGKETRTFSLDSLFNRHSKSATDRRLTIEFTGNPTWYAIQALPSLNMPENNSAISWATAYYANTLASYVMNSQPRIKAMFDHWKLKAGTKETFLSNLQKNQELKNILLSESPWLLEAKTEQEQKERIATLFDLNIIRNNDITSLTHLKELQLSDGSWAWYKGMNGSLYTTSFIVELNARLVALTGKPLEGEALVMQQAALNFLHKQVQTEYQNIQKAEKNGRKANGLPASVLKYLYLIAISDEKVPSSTQAAYRYFLSEVPSLLTSNSMVEKALAAIVLNKAGQKQQAQEFMNSLKQFLTKTDEQGMFFAFKETPYSWGGWQIPAHVDVMEAFHRVTGDAVVVEEMKLWLLKQKQTQSWNSAITTADAVYALLLRGDNLLDNEGNVRISIANRVLDTQSSDKKMIPGLGYMKETFTESKVVDARKVTVEKRDDGIAWGAVYAQYQEDISVVKQQGSEMNIEKKLYVERLVNHVAQLVPVTSQTVLTVGDKVVSRLTIRLDRAMEFIQLKDQRAACFEPIEVLFGYFWNKGFGYYIDVKDASTRFFFDGLGKGVFVLEHNYRIDRSGTYETGIATIQSAYAPEYISHSASISVTVK